MEYGRPEERTREKRTVMAIAYCVEKRTPCESSMVGLQSTQQVFRRVVTTDWTTLPKSEHMKTKECYHECKGTVKTVFIDGSSYKIGNINYSGWGFWSPDDNSFNENGPLKGNNPSSDRAEVRALVAALEKSEGTVDIITDNKYVRDTAQYLE
eukprot:111638-Heterocapsa_arctica.AAC.1